MKKKFSLLLLILVLVMAMTVPAFAKTKLKELENGNFKITWIYDGDLDAAEVFLAGEFNGWKASHPDWKMKKKNGAWRITETLKPGEYEYKFVVNGAQWVKDTEAEKFVPDSMGGQNSVVVAIANNIEGEFETTGTLTHTFEQSKDEDYKISFDNQLLLEVRGTACETKGDKKIKRVKYSGKVNLESNIDNIEDVNEMEVLSLDKGKLETLDVTYLGDWVNVNAQVNTAHFPNSYDYLGLLSGETDKDNAVTPNAMGDVRMLKFTANKGLDAHLSINEYGNRKYLGYFNVKKNLKKSIGQNLTVGSSAVVYQPKLLGREKFNDRAYYGAVFGKYKPTKSFSLKGEYAYVPTGNIDQSAYNMRKNDAGSYTITINLETAIDSVGDFEDKDVDDYERLVLIGGFNDWTEKSGKDYKYELKEGKDNQWSLTVSSNSKISELNNNGWKIVGITKSGGFDYAPSGMGNEKKLKGYVAATKPPAPLKDGNAYLAEAKYKVIDQKASMKARVKAGDYSITKYKGEFTVGVKGVSDRAYLKVADDDFADVPEGGKHEAYVKGNYDVLDSLTVNGKLRYKIAREDHKEDKKVTTEQGEVLTKKAKLGFDWSDPVPGLAKVKGHAKVNPEGTDDFGGEVQKLFLETKTKAVPGLTHITANTTQRLDSNVNGYYLETALDVPVKQIAHLKGNVFYANKDGDTGLKYVVNGKVHKMPVIKKYITHLKMKYKADVNQENFNNGGIIDSGNYDDSDNDWTKKVYAETKFRVPQVNKIIEDFTWDGVTVKGKLRHIEESNVDSLPEDITKDEKYYVANDKKFVNWYSLAVFETGFELPMKTKADITAKYDLNHREISEYENKALFVKVQKSLNMRTKVVASYNKKDEDEGEDYSKLMVKTVF